MKINFKNPTIYYIGIPILAGIWAIMAAFIFYPRSIKAWEKGKSDSVLVGQQIKQLVSLQPQRLAYTNDGDPETEEFDYTKTINDFSQVFAISGLNYNVREKAKRSGRETQSASISIKRIDIETFTQFLSALLLRWPDLKCEQLSIQKIKNTKNNWQVNLSLTYYYD